MLLSASLSTSAVSKAAAEDYNLVKFSYRVRKRDGYIMDTRTDRRT